MALDAKIVKLCSFTQVLSACDVTDPNNPTPIKEVVLIDASGNTIAHDSTAYSSTGTGFIGDGSGFIRSYFTDLNGTPVAAPAAWSYDCSASRTIDVETGCIVDTVDATVAPIPARVEYEYLVDGTTVETFYSLVDGSVIVPTATQQFVTDCDRFDIEEDKFCVRDAGQAIVAQVTRVRVWDTQDTATPATPISETLLNDADGTEYTLGVGETLGSCDVYVPVMVQGCLSDDVVIPATRRQVYQLTPVVNGIPDFTVASYVLPSDGSLVTVGANETFAFGDCGTPCVTC